MQTVARGTMFTGTLTSDAASSSGALWSGRALSGLAILFLLFDAAGKLFAVQAVIEGTVQLGYPPDVVLGLGLTLVPWRQS